MKTLRAVSAPKGDRKDHELTDLRNSLTVLEELAGQLAERVEILETREELSRPRAPKI